MFFMKNFFASIFFFLTFISLSFGQNNTDVASFTTAATQGCKVAQTVTYATVVFTPDDLNSNGSGITLALTGSGTPPTISPTSQALDGDGLTVITIDITTTATTTEGDWTIVMTVDDPDGVSNTGGGLSVITTVGSTTIYNAGIFTVYPNVDVAAISGGSILPGASQDFSVNIINTTSLTTYDWTVAGTALQQLQGDGASTAATTTIDIGGTGNTIDVDASTSSVSTGVTQSTISVANPADGITQSFDVSLKATSPCNSDTEASAGGAFSALPIDLTYFRAYGIDNNQVRLEWATAAEINNDYFSIERSVNGIDFETIREVSGAGDSYETVVYASNDDISNLRNSGTLYYRLKQTDYDGKSTSSDIIFVNIASANDYNIVSIYNDQAKVAITLNTPTENELTATIFDINGKFISTQNFQPYTGINTIFMDSDMLRGGMYVINISNGEQQLAEKFIKN